MPPYMYGMPLYGKNFDLFRALMRLGRRNEIVAICLLPILLLVGKVVTSHQISFHSICNSNGYAMHMHTILEDGCMG